MYAMVLWYGMINYLYQCAYFSIPDLNILFHDQKCYAATVPQCNDINNIIIVVGSLW